ncbi:hypothetical protein PIB30_058163 [Stylosanthes scabra]|uniref:Uncharacterized protein n=1 Tax=Stylosanthes scabra TaxID=79078 RepID=A0ABU6QKU6_9FABA|nr:hypothetical protein [Stylosanthes scabra]
MASSDSSSSHSSSESYPERDSSTSKGIAASSILWPEVPIADDALILVASERSFILRKDGLQAPNLSPILVPRKASSMKTFPSVPDHLPLIFGEKDVDTSYFSRRILRIALRKNPFSFFARGCKGWRLFMGISGKP